jgi:DNA-binding NtrC family response regulator
METHKISLKMWFVYSRDGAMMRKLFAVVVDDEPIIRSYVATLLRRDGFSVLEADSGLEALVFLHGLNSRATLLVSDIVMPRMGGLALAKTVREEFPAISILLMSGYVDTPPADFDFISKPFTAAAFSAAVQRTLSEQTRTARSD